jgi:hypothetical protein
LEAAVARQKLVVVIYKHWLVSSSIDEDLYRQGPCPVVTH